MFYWVYDIPNWLFCVMTVATCIAFGLLGFWIINPGVRRSVTDVDMHNELVSYFFSAAGVFYGITLGLIAVGTWGTFCETDMRVSKEAASLTALYRDVSTLPEPHRSELRGILADYTDFVIDKAWPAQRRGQLPTGANEVMTRFQDRIASFEPETRRHEVVLGEAFAQFNNLIEYRRLRLQAATTGMPTTLWMVVFAGAALTMAMSWFFVFERTRVLVIMITLLAALIGLIIFLTAAMDNPFRGGFSVSPEAFEIVREQFTGR